MRHNEATQTTSSRHQTSGVTDTGKLKKIIIRIEHMRTMVCPVMEDHSLDLTIQILSHKKLDFLRL